MKGSSNDNQNEGATKVGPSECAMSAFKKNLVRSGGWKVGGRVEDAFPKSDHKKPVRTVHPHRIQHSVSYSTTRSDDVK